VRDRRTVVYYTAYSLRVRSRSRRISMSRPSASHVESNVDLPYVRSGSDPIWVLASDLRYIVRCTTRGETELEDRRSVLSQISYICTAV
jgi:hypothetical protein